MRPPKRFFAQMTKAQLAEMMAPTYAELGGIDANEAYLRLESALKDVELIEALQYAVWDGVKAAKPDLDEAALLDLITKKQSKSRKWRAPNVKGKNDGAWTSMGIYLNLYAGVASGEAADLLETDAGQALLAKAFDLLGAHLAAELLR